MTRIRFEQDWYLGPFGLPILVGPPRIVQEAENRDAGAPLAADNALPYPSGTPGSPDAS